MVSTVRVTVLVLCTYPCMGSGVVCVPRKYNRNKRHGVSTSGHRGKGEPEVGGESDGEMLEHTNF